MKTIASGIAVIALAWASIGSPITYYRKQHPVTITVNSTSELSGIYYVANPQNMAVHLDCWGRFASSEQNFSSAHLNHTFTHGSTQVIFKVPLISGFYCLVSSNHTANYFPMFENGQGVGLTIKHDGFYKETTKISGYKVEGEDVKAVFDSWLLNLGGPDWKNGTSAQMLTPFFQNTIKHNENQVNHDTDTKNQTRITDNGKIGKDENKPTPVDEDKARKLIEAAKKIADEANRKARELVKEAEELAKKAKEAEELAKKATEAEELVENAKDAKKSTGATIGVSVVLTIAVLALSI
jgi:hypothetical protein